MKFNNINTEVFDRNFFVFFVIFNLLLMNKFILSLAFKGGIDYEYLIGSWKIAQYFFSYFDEFVKRGFIGTIFDLLNITINKKSIVLTSLFISNIFFIIFYKISKMAFKKSEEKYFNIFMILFLISPATVMHLGFDLGRYDHYMLVVFIISLSILIMSLKQYFKLLPALLAIGILIHEAYLFFYAPIILAAMYYEHLKNKLKLKHLIYSLLLIFFTLMCLYINGKAEHELIKEIENSVLQILPIGHSPNEALKVWTVSIHENIILTVESVISSDWKLVHLILTIPLVLLMFYSVLNILSKNNNFCRNEKMLLFSLLLMLPMYILGIDHARWTALLLTNLFIIFIYLKNTLNIDLNNILFTRKDKIIFTLISLHSLLGPLGISSSYVYTIKLLKHFIL